MCNTAVSILIPVYDVQPYISKCLESVAVQTYKGQMECIIVDDFGNDDSIDISEEFIAGYDGPISFRIIHHERNRGLAAARNTGVAAAKGDFVFHLDGDDWIEPTAIELLVKKQHDTDADIVSGAYVLHRSSGDEKFLEPDFATPMDMVHDAVGMMGYHCVWKRLIRKSLYTDNGILAVEGVDISEDYHTLPRLAYYAKRIAKIDDVIYHYNRLNSNSYTTTAAQSFSMKRFRNIASSIDILQDFFANKDTHCVKQLSASRLYHIYWSLYLCCGLKDKTSFQLIKQEYAISLSYNLTLLIVLLYRKIKAILKAILHNVVTNL